MPQEGQRLEHLPITLFGSVMGLAGLSIAWLRAGEILGLPHWPGEILIHLTGLWLLVLGQTLRAARRGGICAAED